MTAATVSPSLLADEALEHALRSFVQPRAARLDACECTVREGIRYIAGLGVADLGMPGASEPGDLERMCEVIATVAMDDMAQAFSLWAHRMAIEYLAHPGARMASRAVRLQELCNGERLGSTSLASGMANFLGGSPLSLTYRETDGGIVVNGRVAWASNLEAPFISVAAAANEGDPDQRLVFTYSEATPGLQLPRYPDLLALQATCSTSPVFQDAFVAEEEVLSRDFTGFIGLVLPDFLLLQCSFCWGLATRALLQAQELMQGIRDVLAEELAALTARYNAAQARLRRSATDPCRADLSRRDLLEQRLEWSGIACGAVALEAKLAGGRGYMLGSDTARRLREAAFLPIQSPTEVQLRWLLSLYA